MQYLLNKSRQEIMKVRLQFHPKSLVSDERGFFFRFRFLIFSSFFVCARERADAVFVFFFRARRGDDGFGWRDFLWLMVLVIKKGMRSRHEK
jgi:hypothetical protein